MSGWAATNTLRDELRDYHGDIVGRPSKDAWAALALVEAALDAAEPMANLPWPLSADERQEWIVAQNRLRDALRAVREGA